MEINSAEISVKGRIHKVPAASICGRTVIVTGKWIKVAAVHDEDWLEGEVIENPALFIAKLKEERLNADIFAFAQQISQTKPKHEYYFEWDNRAVVPITTYAEWWEKQLPQESRRNVRLAGKRGVVVKVVEFNDELVRGIMEIYNETPLRQGRSFWHYGKDADKVKRENATFLDHSEFIGAYCNNELIGFIKMVYLGGVASIMQIISKNAHLDKKPMNALLAKAVEVCAERGIQYLMYSKFTYGNVYSALTEFKKRNGFEEKKFPRYYVPLTTKGRLAIKSKLHQGLKNALPSSLVASLISYRRKLQELVNRKVSVRARPH